jgi:uncharacterized phage-associated protein
MENKMNSLSKIWGGYSFPYEKIIQILAYLQKKTETKDKLKLIKLLFFADRCSLRDDATFMSSDVYFALKNGPVASTALNMLNLYEDYLNNEVLNLLKEKIIFGENKNDRIIKEDKTDYICEADIDILDFVCDTFGKFSPPDLIELTHDYPEWKIYKDYFISGMDCGRLIIIDDFLKNPKVSDSPAIQKYFNGIDPLYMDEKRLKNVKKACRENGTTNAF